MVSVTIQRVTTKRFLAEINRLRIRRLRRERGWNQVMLAEISGYSLSTIAKLESGARVKRSLGVKRDFVTHDLLTALEADAA